MNSAAATADHAIDGAAAPRKGGKKKLLLAAPVVVVAMVVAGLWFSGVLPGLLGMAAAKTDNAKGEKAGAPAALVFQEMPDLVANLNGSARRPSYIKLKAKLELARAEDVPRVKEAMPRLMDLFQTYVRELRPEELRGSAGTYRLREELIARANIAAAPARVTDVLFTEILVQ